MEQATEAIRMERRAIEELLINWKNPKADSKGYNFTKGYLLGLRRALVMLDGGQPWDRDDYSVWYTLHIVAEERWDPPIGHASTED